MTDIRAALNLTACDVCMSVFYGSAWCHEVRTSPINWPAIPAASPEPERCAMTDIRAALEALVEAIDYTRKTRHLRHAASCYCSVNAALDDARAALAAVPVPQEGHSLTASPEPERCAMCGNVRQNVLHYPGTDTILDDHPFQPAPTPPSAEALRDALLDLIAPPMGPDIVVDGWRSGMRARLDAIIAAARAGYRR